MRTVIEANRDAVAVEQTRPFSHRGWRPQARVLTTGAGMLSIITLMHAGLPLAAGLRAPDRARHLVGALHRFAVPAQRRHHEVVSRRQQARPLAF